MDRLQFVAEYDPLWAVQIQEFFEDHPEFNAYMKYAPMTKRPVGFGINKGEPTPKDGTPKTINEFLQHYVCEAGVRREYGHWLFDRVKGKTWQDIEHDDKITDKKKKVLVEVFKLPVLTRWEQVMELNIKGVGIGAKNFIRSMFSDFDDYIDSTDLAFKIGIQIVYGLDKRPTPSKIKELTKTWTKNAVVGSAMCRQIYRYVYEVNKKVNKNK